MGWSSGTEIFDKMCDVVLDNSAIQKTEQFRILRYLVDTLENADWDCQSDSNYYDHELVQEIFKALHPDWFLDNENDLKEQLHKMRQERNELARMAYVFAKENGIEYEYEFIERYEKGYYK